MSVKKCRRLTAGLVMRGSDGFVSDNTFTGKLYTNWHMKIQTFDSVNSVGWDARSWVASSYIERVGAP